MSLSANEVRFLQKLWAEKPPTRTQSDVAVHMSEHYAIGRRVGSRVEYGPQHHEAAARLLAREGHDLAVPDASRTRAQAALSGSLTEKHASQAPHADSVAYKTMGAVHYRGTVVWTPPGSYQVGRKELVFEMKCDLLLVVENVEPFRRLEEYLWLYEHPALAGKAVLVVCRGSNHYSEADALEVVRRRAEPIAAFVDFDPAGMSIARSLGLERLQAIVLPDETWLKRVALTSSHGRDVFDQQSSKLAAGLDACDSEVIQSRWQLLKSLQSAVMQERMAHAPTTRTK